MGGFRRQIQRFRRFGALLLGEEQQKRIAHADAIAVAEPMLGDGCAVDQCAVAALQVLDPEAAIVLGDEAVPAGEAGR